MWKLNNIIRGHKFLARKSINFLIRKNKAQHSYANELEVEGESHRGMWLDVDNF